MRHNALRNFWAKVITLILAIATWFYVFDVADKDFTQPKFRMMEGVSPQQDFSLKTLRIEPTFRGRSPLSHRARLDQVEVYPNEIHVLGPTHILDMFDILKTEAIDLRQLRENTKVKVGLEELSEFVGFEDDFVEVYIPVDGPGGK